MTSWAGLCRLTAQHKSNRLKFYSCEPPWCCVLGPLMSGDPIQQAGYITAPKSTVAVTRSMTPVNMGLPHPYQAACLTRHAMMPGPSPL